MKKGEQRSMLKVYVALHAILMLYSLGGIASKVAAGKVFFSLPFFLLYGIDIIVLVIYAIGWQQIIKKIPLSEAYANKAATVVWGCIWGVLIFHEHLSVGKIVGASLVIIGIALYGYTDGKSIEESEKDVVNEVNDL